MYGLFLGLLLATKRNISKIVVLGHSLLMIQHLERCSLQKNNNHSLLFHKIQSLLVYFHHNYFYHILRGLNKEVDEQAKKACLLEVGQTNVNGILGWKPIP